MPGMSSTTATIASGQSLSGAITLYGLIPVAIVMPSAWTAADLTFQGSLDGITYTDLWDGLGAAGSEYIVRVSASRYVIFDPVDFHGLLYMKVRSGTAAAPVTQAASRDMQIALRSI